MIIIIIIVIIITTTTIGKVSDEVKDLVITTYDAWKVKIFNNNNKIILFPKHFQLKNFKSVDAMLDKLTAEASIEKSKLLDIFNLNQQNSKLDI
jgi:hypothetical protein